MRIRTAVVAVCSALAALVIGIPPAQAQTGDLRIYNVTFNGGNKYITVSATGAVTVTATLAASDDAGIGKVFIGMTREGPNGELYDALHKYATCKAWNATTSTCRWSVPLDPKEFMRNRSAGIWEVTIQVQTDNDLLSHDPYQTVLVRRKSVLSINATPEPVTKNAPITVTGTIKRADWTKNTYVANSGVSVKLQFKKSGTSTWTTVKTVKSSSTGALRTTVPATADGTWRWHYSGSLTTAPWGSNGDFVDVR
ncbi:calcium-binding protein [Streptomyces aidingensis]|uniref:Calcium-binding protein n=1 Tax=Streptomyces aidingensis TaxID=910347 RepID=A0A1I1Q881_9ACTN|nr:calcium-binding protein [Streptomyces aidingensis]SFD15443.1 hypothetical protein SAMN05421773_110187 [Streptomyces aidingensis]